jgi:hypothetical protein
MMDAALQGYRFDPAELDDLTRFESPPPILLIKSSAGLLRDESGGGIDSSPSLPLRSLLEDPVLSRWARDMAS